MPELNPENAVLQQTREHWPRLAMLIMWKLAPKGESLRISYEEVRRCFTEHGQAFPTLSVQGLGDALVFTNVSPADAKRLADGATAAQGQT